MRVRKPERLIAGPLALALAGVVLALAACGGGGGTTAASAPPATSPAGSPTTSYTPPGASGSGKTVTHPSAGKPSRALLAAMTPEWRRGHQTGQKACAGLNAKTALAQIVSRVKAAEARQHDAVRASMLARLAHVPKRALHGRAAPVMAAALVAVGTPIKQRAGAFAGCMAALHPTVR